MPFGIDQRHTSRGLDKLPTREQRQCGCTSFVLFAVCVIRIMTILRKHSDSVTVTSSKKCCSCLQYDKHVTCTHKPASRPSCLSGRFYKRWSEVLRLGVECKQDKVKEWEEFVVHQRKRHGEVATWCIQKVEFRRLELPAENRNQQANYKLRAVQSPRRHPLRDFRVPPRCR